MCRALENFRRKAKEEGKIEGEKTGENKMYQLIKYLIKDNRREELEEIENNEQKRQELYKFYGIVTE